MKSPTLLRHVSGTVVAATFITYFLFVHHVARPTFAQNVGNTKQLLPHQIVEGELKGGEKHTYFINLRRGDFLHVVLEQHDIDLVVLLRNRAGVELVETNLFGECGPEPSTCASSPGFRNDHDVRFFHGLRLQFVIEALDAFIAVAQSHSH